MKESVFNSEIVGSLRDFGFWAYKIPDFPQSMIRGSRFNPEKPFDIVGMISEIGVAIEGKQMRKFEAFGIRHMRPSQIAEFDFMVDNSAARAFIFLNIRQKADKVAGSQYENRLIILEWSEIRDRLKKESIKKKEIEGLPFIQGKNSRFNLGWFKDLITGGRVVQRQDRK